MANASTMAKINAGVAITEDEAAELDHDAELYAPATSVAYELAVGSDERGWMSPTGEPQVYATDAEAEWARSQIASDRADDEHTAEEIAATIRVREVAS